MSYDIIVLKDLELAAEQGNESLIREIAKEPPVVQ